MTSSVHTSSEPEPPTPAKLPKGHHWGLTLLWVAPVLMLVAILGYGVLTRQPADTVDTTPRVGQPIADFTLPDLQGKSVQLSSLRGKVVFINVWATWCPPCIDEMPAIQKLYDQLHARGLEVLAISIDALGAQVVEPFVRDYQLTFPVLLDPKGTIERLYHTGGVPESFIVDKRGLMVEKIVGPRDWAQPAMRSVFERLLTAPMTDTVSGG